MPDRCPGQAFDQVLLQQHHAQAGCQIGELGTKPVVDVGVHDHRNGLRRNETDGADRFSCRGDIIPKSGNAEGEILPQIANRRAASRQRSRHRPVEAKSVTIYADPFPRAGDPDVVIGADALRSVTKSDLRMLGDTPILHAAQLEDVFAGDAVRLEELGRADLPVSGQPRAVLQQGRAVRQVGFRQDIGAGKLHVDQAELRIWRRLE